MTPNDRLCALGEQADKLASRPAFLIGFNVAVAVLFTLAGVDLANIAISIITADLVLVGLGAARRDRAAMHAKLDALIHATPGASDALMRAEALSEREIEEMRL